MTYHAKPDTYTVIMFLPDLLDNAVLTQAKHLLSAYQPSLIKFEKNNIVGKFITADFCSREQAFIAYEHCFSLSILQKADILATHQGLTQSIWNQPEKRIIRQLKALTGGSSEVNTSIGRIDLLTTSELIEVKPRVNWKSGVGQLIIYGDFYPEHKRVLCLFDKEAPKNPDKIFIVCSEKNIEVRFYLDFGFDYRTKTNFLQVCGGGRNV